MAKMHLKGTNHLDDLICFIEQNEYKNIEVLLGLYPEVIKKKCLDDNEPIYFAIRIKTNKVFNLLLNHSGNANYDLHKLMRSIIEEGTKKMLRAFIDYYKIDLQCPVYKPLLEETLQKTTQFHSYLSNETNLPYSISITPQAYTDRGYTCPYEKDNERYKMFFNKTPQSECYELDAPNNLVKRTELVFMKYEKLFLYTKRATKLHKALKEDTLKEVMSFI